MGTKGDSGAKPMGAVDHMSRRQFVRGAAATGGLVALGGLGALERAFAQSTLPSPEKEGPRLLFRWGEALDGL
jgi:TAT (twin-arginine translocation) pathway signal sequence